MLVAKGIDACRALLSWLYLGVSASTVGALFATYEILKEWGDNRVIKGKGQVFKSNPLTSSVMAEVAREISVEPHAHLRPEPRPLRARHLRTGGRGGQLRPRDSWWPIPVTHSAEKAIGGAMEMMASAGYATEWNLERYWRDTKTMQLCLGPYELAKMDYARYFYQSQAR